MKNTVGSSVPLAFLARGKRTRIDFIELSCHLPRWAAAAALTKRAIWNKSASLAIPCNELGVSFPSRHSVSDW